MLGKIKSFIVKVIGHLPYGWEFLTLQQLRFKFLALKSGIIKNKSGQLSLFNFRRSIHRLEKGLSYSSPKPIFAEDYILETVKMLAENEQTKIFSKETLRWGESVLIKYFEVVVSSEKIDEARTLFEGIKLHDDEKNWIPYKSVSRPALTVSYDELEALSLRRRSVRYFESGPISVELINRAIGIARMAPSACNRQSFQFLFYNDREVARKIAAIPGGVSGYELDNIIIVVGKYSGYFDVRDVNAPVIDASLASMSLLYALETLCLGSVCINWPNLPDRERRIRKVIRLDDDEFIIMMIGVGLPLTEGKIPFSGKRPVEGLLTINDRIIPTR